MIKASLCHKLVHMGPSRMICVQWTLSGMSLFWRMLQNNWASRIHVIVKQSHGTSKLYNYYCHDHALQGFSANGIALVPGSFRRASTGSPPTEQQWPAANQRGCLLPRHQPCLLQSSPPPFSAEWPTSCTRASGGQEERQGDANRCAPAANAVTTNTTMTCEYGA